MKKKQLAFTFLNYTLYIIRCAFCSEKNGRLLLNHSQVHISLS